MLYSQLLEVYTALQSTTKKLEKVEIISEFLKKIKEERNRRDIIYLIQGSVFPESNQEVLGMSEQTIIKAIAQASGISNEEVVKEWKEIGDLGEVAEREITKSRIKQSKKELVIERVVSNIRRLADFVGKGTVEKKLELIAELLLDAKPKEAKYLVRTIIGDLRVGVKEGVLRDAIIKSCFGQEASEEVEKLVQKAYDLTTDFGLVYEYSCDGISRLAEISLMPGKPLKVMLFPKAESISDAFRIVGKPAAFEYKYDGFRVIISKTGEEVKIYNTDPLNPDTDGDTYLDGEEVKGGYNPNGSGKLFELPVNENLYRRRIEK